ncbi:MAG: tetratricopeptide repeat protein [Sandaracinaceae bacterium]|nr:tetratricopeptide repeat protein [Sandaracinaceae bacterium]
MRAVPLSLLLCAALATLAPEGTCAQEPAPAARAEARRVARRASRDYNAGRYDQALEGYRRAYELVPAPGLHFNLGQCYRALGRHEEAIASFELYLRERPDAPNQELARELIRESRAALASAAPSAAAPRERERAALAELERARRELEAARAAGAEQVEQERARYEAALAELEEARAALEAAREEMLARAVAEDAAGPGVAAGPARAPEIYEEWWFWTLITAAVLAAGGITIGVVVGQSPVLPGGTLGTIDAR